MNNVLKLILLCLKNDFYSSWGGPWHSPSAKQAPPMATGTEFETADLDSVINVIGLTPSDPLDTFVEIWYQVFLWALFSSLFVHLVAAVVAFSMLRKQHIGRFSPLFILLMGLVAPLTGGALSSAVIAGVYRAARFHMMPFYALVWGCGQTVFAVVMSYTRVLATLWPCCATSCWTCHPRVPVSRETGVAPHLCGLLLGPAMQPHLSPDQSLHPLAQLSLRVSHFSSSSYSLCRCWPGPVDAVPVVLDPWRCCHCHHFSIMFCSRNAFFFSAAFFLCVFKEKSNLSSLLSWSVEGKTRHTRERVLGSIICKSCKFS